MDPAEFQALTTNVARRWGYEPPLAQVKHLKTWLALCCPSQKRICIDTDVCIANNAENVTKIICHELAHFKEMTHSRKFAKELERMGLETYARHTKYGDDWYEVATYNDPRPLRRQLRTEAEIHRILQGA